MVKLINMTPNSIKWVKPNGETQIIESSGFIRCSFDSKLIETEDDEPIIYSNTYKLDQELPAEQEDVYYIVSTLVSVALSGKRNDVLIINDPVKDDVGRIIGCHSFAKQDLSKLF